MIALLAIAGAGAYLYLSKPPLESFDAFWRTRTLTNRLITTLSLDQYRKVDIDGVLFRLVACVKGGECKWFFGGCGRWARIPSHYNQYLQFLLADGAARPPVDDEGDEWERRGDLLKARGKLKEAAAAYVTAAEYNSSSFQSACLYERAAVLDGNVRNWLEAVRNFKAAGKLARAAGCCVKAYEQSDDVAHLKAAIELYDIESDDRRLPLMERLADAHATNGRLVEASALFTKLAAAKSSVTADRFRILAAVCKARANGTFSEVASYLVMRRSGCCEMRRNWALEAKRWQRPSRFPLHGSNNKHGRPHLCSIYEGSWFGEEDLQRIPALSSGRELGAPVVLREQQLTGSKTGVG